ncbi:hypothetical protein K501DRAFT_216418 [Backusella circina FSU 941]|nr:hypothetical protein K501DRAFT_216418 [Backusella circina FSU 941]
MAPPIILDQELEHLKHSYDFGIVPGSATIFHKDEMHNLGKLDLTLLEGVMVVIQVSDEGYRALTCSPVTHGGKEFLASIQPNLDVNFDSMENLLMALSPKFRDKFYQALSEKLSSVQSSSSSSYLQMSRT